MTYIIRELERKFLKKNGFFQDGFMKKVLPLLLCIIFSLYLSGCSYNPPGDWTKKHHTYEEVLAFAKSIDANATVVEEYTDTVDEYDWEYREWDAVINGVNCHVASVSDWVWNDGFVAGEFVKVYYRIDTDYDYTIIQNILVNKYSNWKVGESMSSKYHHNTNTIFAELILSEYKMMSNDELEQVWQTALEINNEYSKLAIGRKVGFSIPSPGKYYNQGDDEFFVKNDSHAYIKALTEEGKKAFLQEYTEDWSLLESGLPIKD